MDDEINRIKKHVGEFEIVVGVFASTLETPIMYDSGQRHTGFRFLKPGVKHFCTLKAIRAVSGLNAALVLARHGFNQEVCILIRIIIDCNGQIGFVLAGFRDGKLAGRQKEIVEAFFSDFKRNTATDFGGPTIRQKDVHETIGRVFEQANLGKDLDRKPAELMSSVYRTFSNYVHARYPEVMDMYGGNPGRFHMDGMSGTPKDDESIELLTHFTDSVALTLAQMIGKFGMADAIKAVPQVAHWIKDARERK